MNKLLPLVVALAAAGCSFIPEYQRPAAPVPADWPAAEKVGAGGTVSVPAVADWRAFFTDAPLQELIAAALEHNRDLRIAVARVDEARALAGIVRADRFPGVDVGLQQQAARVPGDLNSSGESALSRRYDANLGVAAFELDFWGRVRSLDAAARANFLASDYAQQSFRLALIADVAAAYYSLRELDARLALAEATAQSRAESRQLVERRRDVGLAGDLDFLAADGAWQSARAEAASLARQQAAAANALRLLVGTDLPAATVPPSATARRASFARPPGSAVDSSAPTYAALPEVAVGLPAAVLLRRPDVLAAEQKLIAANANIGAARAAFLPKIVLTATAGSASGALSGLFAGGSRAWSFVPLLKLPLFDVGRSEGNVDLAEARKQIAVADYEKTLQQAFREVADLLAARERYAEQLQALEAAATAQDERLKRVAARHAAGVSSYLELLDAQRELFAAQQAVLTTRRAQATTAASLFKALGGA
jgi:multidrug efflux system outer membrane protein